MTKLDWEKDRRKRIPIDPCPDLPAEREPPYGQTPVSPESAGTPNTAIPKNPDTTDVQLRRIRQKLASPDFANLSRQGKSEELIRMQKTLNKIVDCEGSLVRLLPAIEKAKQALSREDKALRQREGKRR